MPALVYNRTLLIDVLIYHQRTEDGCACGWARLGGSFAAHVADVYEEACRFEEVTS